MLVVDEMTILAVSGKYSVEVQWHWIQSGETAERGSESKNPSSQKKKKEHQNNCVSYCYFSLACSTWSVSKELEVGAGHSQYCGAA